MKLNPPPQYLQKLISGFQKKCATDGQRNRRSQIHRTLPINRISKIDWTIIIQHLLSGSRKSMVWNSNYFCSVSWEAAVWKCSIEWLFWIFRENSQKHIRGGANFWVKVQAKGWRLATKLKIGSPPRGYQGVTSSINKNQRHLTDHWRRFCSYCHCLATTRK